VSTVPVAVLAAGRATRFGGGKLAAPLGGRPLLAYALDAARACPAPAHLVVVGPGAELPAELVEGFVVLDNPDPERGLASSLALAVGWTASHGFDALVVGLGDQPRIPADAWRRVQAAETAGVAVATYCGRRANPVKIAAGVFDLLPRAGEVGARAIFDQVMLVEVPCPGDPVDVDTRSDLAELERRERRSDGDRQ